MDNDYELQPAIKQPSIVPYTFRGAGAERFKEDFDRKVDEEFGGNANLKIFGLKKVDGIYVLTGSNSVVLPVVQSMVPQRRIGKPEDLQRTLNDGDTLAIQGNHYVDLGVVLDFTGRNHEMALDFWEQLPASKLNDFTGLPAVVLGYGLKNFDKGRYNLGLTVNEGTQVRSAKVLAGPTSNFDNAGVSLETGLPSKLGSGKRTLYTASQREPSIDNLGVSGLCLGRSLDLGSGDDYLADSDDTGRVVLF